MFHICLFDPKSWDTSPVPTSSCKQRATIAVQFELPTFPSNVSLRAYVCRDLTMHILWIWRNCTPLAYDELGTHMDRVGKNELVVMKQIFEENHLD